EVASIKPADPGANGGRIQYVPGGGLNMTNVPLRNIIQQAYDVRDFQLTGGPGWVGTDRWDITARPAPGTVDGTDDPAKMTDAQRQTVRDQMGERLRALLADRFHLTVHKETKEQPIYALEIGKSGPKMTEAKEVGPRQGMNTQRGRMEGFAA